MEHSAIATSSPAPADRLVALARDIRAAVLATDHASADGLLHDYAETLSTLWESMSEAEHKTSDLPKITLELFAWARQATLIHRALTAEQLTVLQKASRYQTAEVVPALQVNG